MNKESRFPAWAWWIISAVTILAISILIFSVVLGIRAGQQQVELQRRQQIGIALQAATDAQAEGNVQAAFDAYQKVLVLDPSNTVAQQGIKNLLNLAQGGELNAANVGQVEAQASAPVSGANDAGGAIVAAAASATPGTVPATASGTASGTASTAPATGPATPGAAPSAATTTGVTGSAATGSAATNTASSQSQSYWNAAQEAVRAGRWSDALNQLTLLQRADPGYRTAEVANLLFQTYTSLAAEREKADNLEEALQYYSQALQIRPDAVDVQRAKAMASSYLDVLTYSDADWPRAIDLLEQLYSENPQYRDVETRLQDAHATYGDQLADKGQWCLALAEYESGLSVRNLPALVQKRDAAQTQCDTVGNLATGATISGTGALTGTSTATASLATADATDGMDATASTTAGGGPAIGHILYSAKDAVSGHNNILEQAVGSSAAPQVLLQDATQPAMRYDGTRMAFRNQRNNMAGISSFDPGTGLMLRFTEYAEDSMPSWNPQGSRVAIASNREGDRRWRIYLVWAETSGGTDTLGFGEAPAWNPAADQIAFRGCDQSGNNCGLWVASGSGTNRSALTTVPDDTRPQWSPDGSFVVFMSSSRNGNNEIYRVDVATGDVTRLTSNPAQDVLPVVSPDGAWVAYASYRDGGWKLVAVPSAGGQEHIVAPIVGDMGDWAAQGMQWIN